MTECLCWILLNNLATWHNVSANLTQDRSCTIQRWTKLTRLLHSYIGAPVAHLQLAVGQKWPDITGDFEINMWREHSLSLTLQIDFPALEPQCKHQQHEIDQHQGRSIRELTLYTYTVAAAMFVNGKMCHSYHQPLQILTINNLICCHTQTGR